MTREEAITVLKGLSYNPLFNYLHKAAFSIAIHDIKAYHDWNINNLILVNKDNYESLEQEPRWIPVNERLPKIAGIYRVTRYYPNNVMNPSYLVDACCFDGSNTWYDDNRINHQRAYADNVIAWQENPEPYRAESQERSELIANREIIEQLENAIGLIKEDGKDWLDDRDIPILEACIKSLTALDKIRAEIIKKYWDCDICKWKIDYKPHYAIRGDINDILQILDKYKAEVEPQESEVSE